MTSGNVMGQPMSGPSNSLASFISAKSLPGRDELVQKIFQNEKRCTSCGTSVSSMAKFCSSCGNKA